MSSYIHPTALVEAGVMLGAGTKVWDHVHIRHGARIGEECIIGDKTHIGYDVRIGNRVKINSFVHIGPGVTLEDGIFVGMGAIFTNELFPRATTPDLKRLRPSEPTERTLRTLVRSGTTIGANATLRGGITVGRWAMIGFGATVTASIADFHLVVGAPARPVALVCRCGDPFLRFKAAPPPETADVACGCGLRYAVVDGAVVELTPP